MLSIVQEKKEISSNIIISQIGHVSCQKIRHHNVPWMIFDNIAKSPMKVK
jgi:hypothetical protein